MNTITPSVYWYTTIDVDFNRAAGREAAIPSADNASLGIDPFNAAARPRPSAAWRVTCCAYV